MQLYRDLYVGFESFYKFFCAVRREQRRHILDTDRIRTAFLYLLCVVYIVFGGEYLAESIGYRYLSMRALFLGGFYRGLEVTDVVERVEYTDYVDTVRNGLLNEVFEHIVRIVTISEHILSSEQHLELCIGHFTTQYAQSVPRVFVEEAQT